MRIAPNAKWQRVLVLALWLVDWLFEFLCRYDYWHCSDWQQRRKQRTTPRHVTMTSASDVTELLDYVINIDSSAFTRALSTGNVTTLHIRLVKCICVSVTFLFSSLPKGSDECCFITCTRVVMWKLEITVSDWWTALTRSHTITSCCDCEWFEEKLLKHFPQ